MAEHRTVILNWNANGIRRRKPEFRLFLQTHKFPLVALTETHLSPQDSLNIPGYKIYRKDRNRQGGGVALLVANHIQHHLTQLPELFNLEAVAITFRLNNRGTTLIAAYSPPQSLHTRDIDALFAGPDPVILTGDLNAKHAHWNSFTNNTAGYALAAHEQNSNYFVIAPNEPTHIPWQANHQPDILDIALVQHITHPIDLEVINDLSSDHLPVTITIDTNSAPAPRPPPPIQL